MCRRSTWTQLRRRTTIWSNRFRTSTTKSPRQFSREAEITPELLKAGIRRQTIANKFVPVVGGSAFKNKGVQYLVDAVVDYLPSPLDIPPAKGHEPRHGRDNGSADR